MANSAERKWKEMQPDPYTGEDVVLKAKPSRSPELLDTVNNPEHKEAVLRLQERIKIIVDKASDIVGSRIVATVPPNITIENAGKGYINIVVKAKGLKRPNIERDGAMIRPYAASSRKGNYVGIDLPQIIDYEIEPIVQRWETKEENQGKLINAHTRYEISDRGEIMKDIYIWSNNAFGIKQHTSRQVPIGDLELLGVPLAIAERGLDIDPAEGNGGH